MNLASVTPLLITFNEERNLRRVLNRLTWADRIVVVDSFSTDRTLEILGEHPQVDVIQRPFRSFAAQCNAGLEEIRTDWVLSLDADYVLTEEFVEEMRRLDGHAAGYRAAFTYCVDGWPLRASLYPRRTVLFRRDRGHYVSDGHAHRVDVKGPVEPMKARIRHDDRKPLSRWLDAQRRYAAHEAEKLRRTPPARLGWIDRLRTRRWIVPLLTPLYCLFRRGLLLDGPAGWIYTAQRTYAELLLALYLSEAAQPPRAVTRPHATEERQPAEAARPFADAHRIPSPPATIQRSAA